MPCMPRDRDGDPWKDQNQHCSGKWEKTGSNRELTRSNIWKQQTATEQKEKPEQGTGRIKIK